MEKINFQKETEKILNKIQAEQTKPKLLLQSCCGPCSSYVLSYLTDYFDIYVYYFNPNIYPKQEYIKRLETQKQLLWAMEHKNVIDLVESDYDHQNFLQKVKGLEKEKEGGKRCEQCFRLRLEETAKKAKEVGADFFGTTLTVSPHKNAPLINKIGEEFAEKYGIKFLYSDFKKKEGYKQSTVLSKKYQLYRQDYCGCEFAMSHLQNNENK